MKLNRPPKRLQFVAETKCSSIDDVFAHHNINLFQKLTPWWMFASIVRFEGVIRNGITDIKVGPFGQRFVTVIEKIENDVFVDTGRVLPYPLKYWKHQHFFEKDRLGYVIIRDVVEYKSWLPIGFIIKALFKYRKKVLEKYNFDMRG